MTKHVQEVPGLESSPLFACLEETALAELSGAMRRVRFARGEIIFVQEDEPEGCYCVIEGSLKISILDDEGSEIVVAVLGPGDVIGELGLVDGAPRSATVTALKASELASLSKRDFERVADAHPAIYRHLLKIISGRLRATNETVTVRQNLPLDGKLAHTLLRLADGFGKPLDGGRLLIFQKFTQADIGLMIGVARENVSRQLNQWCRDGLLSKISGYYCIENCDRLKTIARSSD
ncbi:MAG: Crp/Fnr family transcriptional regulator [Hyphomicrobiales bacterium]|nr:Crp/Fnr family transcriptional regulator [Hyphomicrobiales bacterium]